MKPNLSLKFLEGVTERLRDENSELKKELDSMKDTVKSLQSELQALQIIVSENIERREAVETGLVAVEQSCSDLQGVQGKLSSALELQAQYSRKSTLLLSGRAIPAFKEGERTRLAVIALLKEYLGIDVHPRAVTACHRLQNKSVILVRFADMDERMAVYRQRLKPLKHGLLVHESLTNERLSVIKVLQKLHKPRETSPIQSYYTSMGRIFIRLTDVPKAIELSVGTTEKDIMDICQKHGARGAASTRVALAGMRQNPPSSTTVGRAKPNRQNVAHQRGKDDAKTSSEPSHVRSQSMVEKNQPSAETSVKTVVEHQEGRGCEQRPGTSLGVQSESPCPDEPADEPSVIPHDPEVSAAHRTAIEVTDSPSGQPEYDQGVQLPGASAPTPATNLGVGDTRNE